MLLASAWLFWPHPVRHTTGPVSPAPSPITTSKAATPASVSVIQSAGTAPQLFATPKKTVTSVASVPKTKPFPYRLANTTRPIGELQSEGRALLLANAFIDTRAKLNFSIPPHLQSAAASGTYIVQSRTPLDTAFRAQLASAGAEIVSYIPNNAYLVRMTAAGAAQMSGRSGTSAVLPYEPYYKINASLLGAAVTQKALPDGAALTLGLFADDAARTVAQIEKLGGTVLATDRSPFGPMVRVLPPSNWTALALLPGVQIVEPSRQRVSANDLARVRMGISTDTVTNANYGGLSGSNVTVAVIDSGIDATHPDFATGRVTGISAMSLTDTNGHGTHVAGIIAGNGARSSTLNANEPQGSVTNADFRGKAPLASLFSVDALADDQTLKQTDRYLQETVARTNILISNNSWVYSGQNVYDLAAASYDAAVRDALPETMGSQPVLFVFAAGNDGGGNTDGGGGAADTVLSPGTAKNVITVGALEQLRNITNEVVDVDGNTNAVWEADTDTDFQVASYSARGNVGVGTEGTYGRFKPDVVAPGNFVVSTRSSTWDEAAYYNPTNYYRNVFSDQVVAATNSAWIYDTLTVPSNAVAVRITVVSNANSPQPFPNLPIYIKLSGYPSPTDSDIAINNSVSIPPDTDGAISGISSLLGTTVHYAVGNTNNFSVSYDLVTVITTTNDQGNYFQVLSNLNATLAPYYRYESGTSMSAPAVSGALALMQDYFTNTLRATPSPALLKALLINGARSVDNEYLVVSNAINFQGWGLPSVPNSVPPAITNQYNAPCASFFADQSPTNALATGDQRTFLLTVSTNSGAAAQPLRVTLAWTDPPGDPIAATKLVNNLDLIVTNLTTGAIYLGNDIPRASSFSAAWDPTDTNAVPNFDSVNNVENVFMALADGTSYSVTVLGRAVNVNAVTAQTNDVVQDFSLVISSGNGGDSNALTVAESVLVSHPTDAQRVTPVANTLSGTDSSGTQTSAGGILLNQIVGANPALLGTNTIPAGTNTVYATNAVITLGMTNQWHFYVVTNTTTFTNAAFITFLPNTLSVPRMGVYADTEANATQPEADIDLYVTTNPAITNLDPAAIAGADKSLSSGGTEFVVYSNSVKDLVYYIGVKSETAEAAEYGFLSVFSLLPFSQTDANGNQLVSGLLLPAIIADGSPEHPGVAYVFGIAVQPMEIRQVVVGDQFQSENFGDLVGLLSHSGKNVVLNNHSSVFNSSGVYTNFYNDTGNNLTPGSMPTDGPGSLQDFQGKQAVGPWIMTVADSGANQSNTVTAFSMVIAPHKDLNNPGVQISVQPGEFFVDYIDVPAGAANLTVSATNLPPPAVPPLELYVTFGSPPSLADSNSMVLLTNGISPGPLGNSISLGPPLTPGRYYVGIRNPDIAAHDVWISAAITFSSAAASTVDFTATNTAVIWDDAVSYASLVVTNRDILQSLQVGLRVDHPRISDLVFHLISPDGTRYLLMENRGNTSTNGAGATIVATNIFSSSASGGPAGVTNFYDLHQTSGTIPISWNFYTVPDTMDVYYQSNLIFSSGLVSFAGSTNLTFGPGTSTEIEVVINATNHPARTLWTYTLGGIQTNIVYLAFTGDTNLTTTPIKFASPPFVPTSSGELWSDNFDTAVANAYVDGTSFSTNWTVLTNSVDITTNPPANSPPNLLALNSGAVSNNLPTVAGQKYTLSYLIGSSATDTNSSSTNANWQFVGINFTATKNGTPLVLDASGSGLAVNSVVTNAFGTNVLFDNFSLSLLPDNLYYQPEVSLESLVGQSAYGLWQLEIQDDRVGAGLTNTLVSWQLEMVFANTNLLYLPVITTPATDITFTSAILNALVYPLGVTTTLYFEYGTNTAYGLLSDSVTLTTNLNLQQAIGISVTNLLADVLYHFRAVASNSTGIYYGGDLTFLAHTGPPPYAATLPATLITGASAQLNGMATPNSLASTAWFQWGTNLLYGNSSAPVAVGAGVNVVYTNTLISGLLTNVAYHYRLVVSNAMAVVYGFDQVLDESYVVAWGADYVGQINVPVGLSNAVSIAGAYDHSLAVKNNGTAVAWGENNFGESTVPASLTNVVAVAGGESYSMALNGSGIVSAWGLNNLHQTNVPAGLSNVVSIAAGAYSSLALKADGKVTTWGLSFLNVPAGLSNGVAVAGGKFHSLALKNDGTVTAWGDNGSGQTDVPAGLSNVVAIAAGGFHNLALKRDGTVVAWGDNTAGQTNVPGGLGRVVAIAAGGFHSLALQANGTVVAWGDSSTGQGTVPGALASNVVAIAAGNLHSLAMTSRFINSTNPTLSALVAAAAQTNAILGGGINYYAVEVPTNADFATNILLFTQNGSLNLWWSTNTPYKLNSGTATLLLPNATNGVSVLTTNGLPALVPGSTYYLGVQNTNTFAVSYGLEVDFHLLPGPVPAGPPLIGSVTLATNGLTLSWSAPTNEQFTVQYATNLDASVWADLAGPITSTNGLFTFTDTNAALVLKFYRLLLLP